MKHFDQFSLQPFPPGSSASVKGTEHKTQMLKPSDLYNDDVRSQSPQKTGLLQENISCDDLVFPLSKSFMPGTDFKLHLSFQKVKLFSDSC